jgi:glycosyltransferase involved in cell wall biosynthesis
MNINIALPVFRRAEYAKQAIESILAMDGVDKTRILASVDRSKDGTVNKDMVNVLYDYEIPFTVAKTNLGCNGNLLRAIDAAWDSKPDAVMVVEDDIILSKSAFQFAKWALANYRNDPSVRNITLWEALSPASDPSKAIKQAGKFTCWGWVCLEKEWEGMKANWSTDDDLSWDIAMERYLGDRYEIAPVSSLATNIGHYDGTHRGAATPAYLSKEYNGPWHLDESLTIYPKMPVYVIMGRFGDIYMVCKKLNQPSIICCMSKFADVVYEFFPQHTVFELDETDPEKAASICISKYPLHKVTICQLDQRPRDLCKPYRNYQAFQEYHASL